MIPNPFGVIVLQSKTYVVEWIESLGQQVFNYTHHGVDLKNMVVSGMSLFKKHFNFETFFLSIPGWLYAIFAAQPFDSALVSSLSHSRPLAASGWLRPWTVSPLLLVEKKSEGLDLAHNPHVHWEIAEASDLENIPLFKVERKYLEGRCYFFNMTTGNCETVKHLCGGGQDSN